MSNCNHLSLSCNQQGPWYACGRPWGCNSSCGWTGCGDCNSWNNGCTCSCGDRIPACNPCAPWGSGAVNTTCRCGRCNSNPCTCGSATCCNSTCDTGCDTPCGTCGQWDGCTNVSGGCLLPRIISTGRTFQRRITQTLCADDLPECLESPLTLVRVSVCGPSSWEQISECRQSLLRVTVPVAIQVQDCAGRCRTGHSTVTLTIPLCTNCPAQDFWRGQLFVTPCIRLAAPVTENEDGCFDAPLEVQAEVFLVRMQVVNC